MHMHGKSPHATREEYHPHCVRIIRVVQPRPNTLTLIVANSIRLRGLRLRIVLSNIGTFGDINPLIAIALELKQRGHVPVMALPAVYEPKIRPLGSSFTPSARTSTDQYDSRRDGLRHKERHRAWAENFLFPALRQTYDDLLDAATKPERADLLLLGELNYAGPLVAEVTGIPWASYVLAPLSFFSAFDPPVLPPYPRMARADKLVPGFGRNHQASRGALPAASGPNPSRTAPPNWDCQGRQPAL